MCCFALFSLFGFLISPDFDTFDDHHKVYRNWDAKLIRVARHVELDRSRNKSLHGSTAAHTRSFSLSSNMCVIKFNASYKALIEFVIYEINDCKWQMRHHEHQKNVYWPTGWRTHNTNRNSGNQHRQLKKIKSGKRIIFILDVFLVSSPLNGIATVSNWKWMD